MFKYDEYRERERERERERDGTEVRPPGRVERLVNPYY